MKGDHKSEDTPDGRKNDKGSRSFCALALFCWPDALVMMLVSVLRALVLGVHPEPGHRRKPSLTAPKSAQRIMGLSN